MAIEGKITSLYTDYENTQALFPRTKTKAVSDDSGVNLDALLSKLNSDLSNKASESFVTNEIAKAQLGGGDGAEIDLSGFATKDELNNIDFPVDSINGKTGDVTLSADDVDAVKKSGDIITGMVQFKPQNGTSVITTETYRDTATASSKTRNVIISSGDAAMQLYKNTLGEEPSTEVNRLTLTETDTQLMKPLNVASGGTGATTSIEALANLFALNLNDITDERFMVQSGDDYDNYTTPGAYRIATAAIAKSLLNRPSYASAGGRLIVSATSSNSAGRIQIVIFNTYNYQIHFRIQTSTGTWGEWDCIKTNNHMTDYVVAEGISGNWSYRKWNSGFAECWHYKWITPTALSSAAQVLTKRYTSLLTFPFDFIDENYTAVASVAHSNGLGVVVRVEHTSASQVTITWEGSDEVLSTGLNIYVTGYWK